MATAYAIQVAMVVGIMSTAAYRMRVLRRRPDDRAARALVFAQLAFGIALALGHPALYAIAYRLLGETPALPQLLQHGALAAMAYQMQVFTLHVMLPRDRRDDLRRGLRHRRRWLTAALIGMLIGYLSGPLPLGLPMLGASGHRDFGVAAYVTVVHGYAAVAILDIGRMCWLNRHTERRFLRVGISFICAGCALGVLLCLHKIGYFVASAFGARPPWAENGAAGIQMAFLAPAVLLTTIGMTLSSWGPRTARWCARYRTHHRLRPLANALRQIGADVATVTPGRFSGVDTRLLGRVVAIRDCLIGPLHPWLDAGVYRLAYRRAVQVGQPVEEARAIAEAACVAAAVRDACGVAERAARLSEPPHPAPSEPPRLSYGADLDAEAAWLARVSRAYAGSPVVRAVLAERETRL